MCPQPTHFPEYTIPPTSSFAEMQMCHVLLARNRKFRARRAKPTPNMRQDYFTDTLLTKRLLIVSSLHASIYASQKIHT